MINAVVNTPFEAVTGGHPSGLTLTLEVYDPTTAATILAASGAGITEPRPGTYRASRTVTTAGTYMVRWVRTDTSAVIFEETLDVLAGFPAAPPGPSLLISLDEFRLAIGADSTDHRKDELYEQAIAYVSRTIINYTERDFGAPTVTQERTYEYDGSGYLDIDDASAVTAVKLTVPGADDLVLAADEWRAMPNIRDDSPVFYYLLMPGVYGLAGSPEMGFTKNLDVYAAEGRWIALPPHAKVTGTWGWPVVPDDVKMAAIWTLQDWTSRPQGEGLTAEAIEGWSRSWAGRGNTGQVGAALALPNRARDILSFYQKIHV